MSRRDIAWYENEELKTLYLKAATQAFTGYHCPISSPKITYVGTNSLIDLINQSAACLPADNKRVLIVVDKDLRKFAENVAEKLDSLKGIDSKIFDNIHPDVPKNTVFDGVKACEEYDPKGMIVIGGGSAMDTAKMILLFYEQPNINLNNLMVPSYLGLRKKIYYMAAIPTTSGTGSEATPLSVITDTDRDPPKKTVVYAYELVFDFVALYPEFVKTMPPYLTMGTGMDALAHAMGALVLNRSNVFCDMHDLKAIELILKYLPRAVKRGNDMEAREKMQWAAYIAGIGFGNISAGVEHSLGHSFGALFHIHHGVSVGIFLAPSVAYQSKVTDRVLEIAKVWDIETKNRKKDEILRELFEKLQTFMKKIGAPVSIQEIERPKKISREEYIKKIEKMVDYTYRDIDTLFSTRKLDPPQIRKILEIAYENKIEDLMELYYK
ncbi:MAG: iron-containing alcohol dehydrogenase [Candidatus Hodarchaeota archaeon]